MTVHADVPGSHLTWLLEGLAAHVPGALTAVLLSRDGLVKTFSGTDRDTAAHLAAVACGMYSLAGGSGRLLNSDDQVRQIAAELDTRLVLISSAGKDSRLVVVADTDADPAVIGHEMQQLAGNIRVYQDTPARQDPAPDPNGAETAKPI
ncbi:roadblock/LC7 domain-containing protein [Streptomyces sp. F63]|uniref:roadblock/LC7 domain-containing protein n=1 Tax=Streptomyces sp. F63 TaxID=2824887 RepID=UPI001B37C606|nr:roadblock/LC7 domain-containing protein [Streptomyces sp. F63]MBQ0983506.1 roadblock/LC7 domain-containing protein [Streptomyces sp. F63]